MPDVPAHVLHTLGLHRVEIDPETASRLARYEYDAADHDQRPEQ